MPEAGDLRERAEPPEPVILSEDGGVVAIGKPAGIATQAPAGIPSVEGWLRKRLRPGAYLGVPHRVDRAVSGVLLMAATPRAARKLARQFERREIEKTYLALVSDAVANADGGELQWRDFLVKIPDEPRARIATTSDRGAREAITTVTLVARAAGVSILEMRPLTGRMHQLRVQAASRGMPIIGDTMYGGPVFAGVAVSSQDARHLPIALHARQISFTHPETSVRVSVVAPLPTFWPAEVRSLLAARS